MMYFTDLKSQYESLQNNINLRIKNVLQHGQYILGPEVSELENKLTEYTEAEFCIAVSSGTDALLMSLMALGIGPGDEVITSPFSFISAVEVIALLGAKPIFADIEKDTCNINALLIEEKITPKTKAIIPVSIFGQPSDMDLINNLAIKHKLVVIEDAAQSFGATYKNKKSCNLSAIGCTSFFPTKPLGCYGDGGAIFTSDKNLAALFSEIRVHGQKEKYIHNRIGLGARIDTVQAAILLAKLENFTFELDQRSLLADKYNRAFKDKVTVINVKESRTSVYAQYTIITNKRDHIKNALNKENIPSAIHYPLPIHLQPAYKIFCCPDCLPVAEELANNVLSIPFSPYLKSQDQNRVIDTILSQVEL